MKKTIGLLSVLFIAVIFFLASCAKKAVVPTSSCTITFNSTDVRTADSIHWDYYGSIPRVQAFIGGTAVVTLWPGSISSGTYALSSQYLYWIIQAPAIYTVNSSGGTATISNSNNILSGSLTASGNIYTGTGPSPTTISATFSNVRQAGH
jgi:hypothetical protein